jgi:hypothetical protein
MNDNVNERKRRYEKPTLSEMALRPDGFHSRCSAASVTAEPDLSHVAMSSQAPATFGGSELTQKHKKSVVSVKVDAQGE